MNSLANIPSDLSRDRLLKTEQAAEFLGLSIPHFRRLYRAKKVPSPIKIGERQYRMAARGADRFRRERNQSKRHNWSLLKRERPATEILSARDPLEIVRLPGANGFEFTLPPSNCKLLASSGGWSVAASRRGPRHRAFVDAAAMSVIVTPIHTAAIGATTLQFFRRQRSRRNFPGTCRTISCCAWGSHRIARGQFKCELNRAYHTRVRAVATQSGIATIAPHLRR